MERITIINVTHSSEYGLEDRVTILKDDMLINLKFKDLYKDVVEEIVFRTCVMEESCNQNLDLIDYKNLFSLNEKCYGLRPVLKQKVEINIINSSTASEYIYNSLCKIGLKVNLVKPKSLVEALPILSYLEYEVES